MTQIENKRKTQHSKVKRRWIQKPRATPGAREGWVVPVSYYIHAVLLIYSWVMCPMLPVSLDCPFLRAPPVLSNLHAIYEYVSFQAAVFLDYICQ
jgi:hypothetical protein